GELPVPDDLAHAVGAWRTWLAERGSGLVPIADPGRFQWPGWWIATVDADGAPEEGAGSPVAVLAFGTPPGVGPRPQAPGLLAAAGQVPDSAATRRNVLTRGIDVNALVGRTFRIGDVLCEGRRLCEPCAHLERLSGPGVLRPLIHRGGLRVDIRTDGEIRLGA